MYFCPNCNNVFDITKNPHEKNDDQIGGAKNYQSLINKIINKEDVNKSDLQNVSLDELSKDISYKKLNSEQKKLVYNKIQQLLPVDKKLVKDLAGDVSPDKAYFICRNCGFLKPLNDNTLIFSRVSSDISQSYTSSDPIDMANSDILPRTRKYICPNNNCISQVDSTKREACFFRINNSYKIKYICLACRTWF